MVQLIDGAVERIVERVVERVDAARLRAHVERLAGLGPRAVADVAARQAAVEYLVEQLTQFGYQPQLEPVDTRRAQVNVLVQRPGGDPQAAVRELGAHLDTVPGTPGADDNASGVAGVLEIARLLASLPPGPHPLRLCLFDAEESGLGGSRRHVANLDGPRQRPVEGALVFEMIGYRTGQPRSQRTPVRIPLLLSPPRTGDFLLVVANYGSRRLAARFERAARRYVPGLKLFAVKRLGGWFKDAARSDHLPYWRSGRAGVMLTDTANFRNPHYHRPSDTPETLDYAFLADVTRAAAASLLLPR